MERFKERYHKWTEHIKYPAALQTQYIIYFNGILMYSVINIYLYTRINVCKFAFNKYETMLATDQKVCVLSLNLFLSKHNCLLHTALSVRQSLQPLQNTKITKHHISIMQAQMGLINNCDAKCLQYRTILLSVFYLLWHGSPSQPLLSVI